MGLYCISDKVVEERLTEVGFDRSASSLVVKRLVCSTHLAKFSTTCVRSYILYSSWAKITQIGLFSLLVCFSEHILDANIMHWRLK